MPENRCRQGRTETRPSVKKKDRATEIANTFEWLITAFILAFVFRAFVMEAFRIPTGSMADTLKGAHFRLRCPQCGYAYDHGFVPQSYGMPEDTVPSGAGADPPADPLPKLRVLHARQRGGAGGQRRPDPRAQVHLPVHGPQAVGRHRLQEPDQPHGELHQAADRAAGRHHRDHRRRHLYQRPDRASRRKCRKKSGCRSTTTTTSRSIRTSGRGFNGHRWQPPFNLEGSAWKINDENPTQLVLDGPADQTNVLTYGAPSANGFATTYAYNEVYSYARMPTCSDLMVRFYVQPAESRRHRSASR